MNTSQLPRVWLVLMLCAVSAAPATGQAPTWSITQTSPFGGPGAQDAVNATMSASGRYVALLRHDLRVYDVVTGAWDEVPKAQLVAFSPPLPEGPFGLEGFLFLVGISDDGRYVAYGVQNGPPLILARYDRMTGVIDEIQRGEFSNLKGRSTTHFVMSRNGSTIAWVQPGVVPQTDSLHTWRNGAMIPLPFLCVISPALSADGARVAYRECGRTTQDPVGVSILSFAPGPVVNFRELWQLDSDARLTASGDLRFIALSSPDGPHGLFDTSTRVLDPLAVAGPRFEPLAVSDDGGIALARRTLPAQTDAIVYEPRSGLAAPLGEAEVPIALTADGRHVLTHGRAADSQYTLSLWALDADEDQMLDGWEVLFGLDPTDPTDAALDANGDGVSNLAAFEQRTHPTAVASATRLFAEGAANFFDTTVSLFNPGPTPAAAVLRLLGADGEHGSRIVPLAPLARADVRVSDVTTFTATEFSMVLESDMPVVADRRMQWQASYPYGMHASTGVATPSTAWYFAEGATIAGLQTFYLLQNPGDVPVDVTLEYLLQGGGGEVRAYTVAPRSRTTVWVNQEGPGLAHAEFATVVSAGHPVVAERSMYRDIPGQFFSAGTNAIGVTAPALQWTFAEGAVGDFFDTFVLVANPGPTDAVVTARLRPEGMAALEQTFVVPRQSRYTLWVDQAYTPTGGTGVSVALTSTEPVVSERVMWWPRSSADWSEGHVEFGATEAGQRFAIADGELDATTLTDTFLLVDVVAGGTDAEVRLTAYPDAGPPHVVVVPVLDGRNTLWIASILPGLDGHRFAAVVESIGGSAVLTVEKAIYRGGLQAGAAALATRLPD
jgi:hypothetical protein